jgi:ubiquinone/menaquinone biosynthesis C-methylase UbiE
LHLLPDYEATIAQVYQVLKPGGLLILTRTDLETALTQAGFALDYQWKPDQGQAVFIVAKKTT